MAAKGNAEPAAAKPKGGVPLMVVLVIVLLVGGGAGGGVWFMTHKAAAPSGEAAAEGHGDAHADEHGGGGGDEHGGASKAGQEQYLGLDPTFVVNTADEDAQHYLQADVQVMSRSTAALDAVKTHMPRIRNNLLMLFAQQKTSDVRDRDGREKLRAAALKEVQDVLQAEIGKPGVEAIYFTSFVTQ